MTVITIAYQIGSGGRQIGQALAKRLDLDYIDREIVQGVAQQLHVSEEAAARLDERARGLVTRMLLLLSSTGEMALYAPPPERNLQIDEAAYFKTTRAVIEAAARTNRAVIAGHGANFALAGRPGVLHVFIYAPAEQRITAIMEREQVDRPEATRRVNRSDHDRAHYVKRFYRMDWRDPSYYDLMINTAHIQPDCVVDLLIAAWQESVFGSFS
jgi:cytidylate kinase